jgi:hypothetical protein
LTFRNFLLPVVSLLLAQSWAAEPPSADRNACVVRAFAPVGLTVHDAIQIEAVVRLGRGGRALSARCSAAPALGTLSWTVTKQQLRMFKSEVKRVEEEFSSYLLEKVEYSPKCAGRIRVNLALRIAGEPSYRPFVTADVAQDGRIVITSQPQLPIADPLPAADALPARPAGVR